MGAFREPSLARLPRRGCRERHAGGPPDTTPSPLLLKMGALLLGSSAGVVGPVLLGGLLSTSSLPGCPRSDFEYYFYPMRCFFQRAWTEGVLPLWNPHLFCGYPVVEIVQSALLYPPNAVTLGWQPEIAIAWLTTAHLVFNYVGIVLVLWRLFGFSLETSAVAAALPNVSAVYAYRFFAGHLTVILALPWLGLAAGAAQALNEIERRRAAHWVWGLLAGSIGAIFLAGAPQYALYALWSAAAILLATAGLRLRLMSWGVVALLFGLAVAAPQLAATLDYVRFSARSGGWSHVFSRSGTIATYVETLLWAPLGNGVDEAHLSSRGIWDTNGYIGTPALLCAAAALTSYRRHPMRLRTALVLVVLGLHLVRGGWLPGFSGLRDNQRAIVIVHLGTTILVAVALEELLRAGKADRLRVGRNLAALSIAFLGALQLLEFMLTKDPYGIGHSLTKELVEKVSAAPVPYEWHELRSLATTTLSRACNWGILCASLTAVSAVAHFRSRLGAWLVLGALTVLEPLWVHWPAYAARTPLSTAGLPNALRRQVHDLTNRGIHRRLPPSRWRFPTSLTNAAQCLPGVLDVGGYDPLMPELALGRRPFFMGVSIARDIASLAVSRTLALRWEIAEAVSQPEFVPPRRREYVVRDLAEADGGGRIATIETSFVLQPGGYKFGPLFDTTHTLETGRDKSFLDKWLSGLTGEQTKSVRGLEDVFWLPAENPNQMWIHCCSATNAVLIVKSTWLPGWCVVDQDGRRLPLLRVNGWMMGVPIPPGATFLSFSYRPPSWRLATFVSLLAVGLILVIVVGKGRPASRPGLRLPWFPR